MKKVLIKGAAGFIGRHLVKLALEKKTLSSLKTIGLIKTKPSSSSLSNSKGKLFLHKL